MKKNILILFLAGTVLASYILSCSKDKSDSVTLRVRLTDNPVNAEAVNVDIRQVRVNLRQDSSGWIDLTTQAGIYDLLGLQNGVDTLIASGTLPSNYVQELRLVLGNNNSIKVNGITYPLTIPSGEESGLKIKVNKRLQATLDSLIVDFDAGLSIYQTGNGEYKLKPVLKLK